MTDREMVFWIVTAGLTGYVVLASLFYAFGIRILMAVKRRFR